jgi:hypothetical protein
MREPKVKPDKIMKFSDGEFPIKEGQIIAITNVNDRGREPRKCMIKKIGTKLVEIYSEDGGYPICDFYLDGTEKSDYRHNSIYSSLDAIIGVRRKQNLISAIDSSLRNLSHKLRELPEETLNEAIDLLGIREEVEEFIKNKSKT